jgi:hypothetical protein
VCGSAGFVVVYGVCSWVWVGGCGGVWDVGVGVCVCLGLCVGV